MPQVDQQQRQQVRQNIRQQRRLLSSVQQQQAAETIKTQLIQHPKIQQATHIALTLPHDGEIDTTLFIQWCWEQNKQTYLPVVHPFSKGHLLFLHYHAESKMQANRYGILEPELSQTEACPVQQLDIICTPLVAFDKQGNRIGMGGGYYDRMLAPWFENKQGPYPIGLAHDCQQVEQLPIANWDVPLPEIITPTQHHLW